MIDRPFVEILMATYNGEKYLPAQLDSIFSQSYKNWNLLVRDDGSSDATIDVLKEYAATHPGKINLIEDRKKRLGPCQSFARLLEKSTANYVMFSDQDDVWMENKVEVTLDKIMEIQREQAIKPIIVHTDLVIVNENLKLISPSLHRYQKLPKKLSSIYEILLRNNITGCTMGLNRKAIQVSLPIPKEAFMHDFWLGASVLKNDGVIFFIDIPTVKYRQHRYNNLGVEKVDINVYLDKVKNPISTLKNFSFSYKFAKKQGALLGKKITLFNFVPLKIYMILKCLMEG